MESKRQAFRIGDVYEVPLANGYRSYGQRVSSAFDAFYNVKSKEPLNIGQIVQAKVIFTICISLGSFRRARWKKIGKGPLPDSIFPIRTFTQDVFNKSKIEILEGPKSYRATKEDVEGLERAAAWDADSVIERLEDYFCGRPNKSFESMRVE
jgi:hypothetical protein